MRSLRATGVALSVVFGCLLFALLAELYYLLWWRRRVTRRGVIEDGPGKNLFCFFFFLCRGKQSPPPPLPPPPGPSPSPPPGVSATKPREEGEEMDSELSRLAGPPRFLFTIKEETREDLESEGHRKPRRRLSDVLFLQEDGDLDIDAPSPTPYFTPPLTPLNPLFEPSNGSAGGPSPPPTFKFLRDAEEKLLKRRVLEADEAQRFPKKTGVSFQVPKGEIARHGRPSPPTRRAGVSALGEEERGENGSFVRMICPRRGEEEIENVSASQVLPLPSNSSPSHFI